MRHPQIPGKAVAGLGLLALVTLVWSCGPGTELATLAPGQPLWETATSAGAPPAETPEHLARGKDLYAARCAVCHGHEGDGQGPAALYLGTPPRDFRQGWFKFRTSPTGALPTDEDLFRTVTAGFPTYGMPSFAYLPENDRWAVVHYLKTLSGAFDQESTTVVDLGVEPRPTADLLAQGKSVFVKAQCGACHGEDGRGLGPSAATLKDNLGRPIRTLDLASPDIYYKGGARARDILRTLSTGLAGTPMPSYLEAGLSQEELWSLAHYVTGLSDGGE